MRKIDITPYKIKVLNATGEATGEANYRVRESLAAILFIPGQDLPIRESIKRDKLATRIENEPKDFILLEEAEWEMLNKSVAFIKDARRDDLELLLRITEAEQINLHEVVKEA